VSKIRQRLWSIPGQRTKRKAWGFVTMVDGKQVRQFRSEWTPEDAARELERVARGEAPQAMVAAPSGMPLDVYADRWLTDISANIAPKTLSSYRDTLARYIRPILGAIELGQIQRGQIKAQLAAKRNTGLGKNSIRIIRATLSVMLNDAVEDGVLAVNPAAGIGRGRRKRGDTLTQAERRQQIRPLTPEQLADFLQAAAAVSRRDAVLFLVLADAGLRPGEALALRWEDLDVAGRSLRVTRALSAGAVKSTKTGEIRDVDLTRRLATALSQYQAEQEAEALVAGHEPSPWMFTEERAPLDAERAARRFRAILRRAGWPCSATRSRPPRRRSMPTGYRAGTGP
jgi:integrase